MTYCISLFLRPNMFVVLQILVPNEGKDHKEEDSSCEEDPEPPIRPHVCVQGAGSGAAGGDVSGADGVGQRGHVEQRISGRTSSRLHERYKDRIQ